MTKPTVEQLEELSAKATPGDWERDCQSHYDSSERQHYIEHYLTGHLRDRVCTANHGDAQEIRHDDDGIYQDERARTDLEFIAALVNFWRSGGAELVRDGLVLRDIETVAPQTVATWRWTIDAARKDMSAKRKGE